MAERIPDAFRPATPERRRIRDALFTLAQEIDDLGDGKDAQTDDGDRDGVRQVFEAERHSPLGGRRRGADGAQQEANAASEQPLIDARARKDADHAEAEYGEHEQLGRGEQQDHRPGDDDEHRQHQGADYAAEH
jgi:hypothetical protein